MQKNLYALISGVAYLLAVLVENVNKLFVQFTKLLHIAVNSQKDLNAWATGLRGYDTVPDTVPYRIEYHKRKLLRINNGYVDRCFFVIFLKFLRLAFIKNTSGWLLLALNNRLFFLFIRVMLMHFPYKCLIYFEFIPDVSEVIFSKVFIIGCVK